MKWLVGLVFCVSLACSGCGGDEESRRSNGDGDSDSGGETGGSGGQSGGSGGAETGGAGGGATGTGGTTTDPDGGTTPAFEACTQVKAGHACVHGKLQNARATELGDAKIGVVAQTLEGVRQSPDGDFEAYVNTTKSGASIKNEGSDRPDPSTKADYVLTAHKEDLKVGRAVKVSLKDGDTLDLGEVELLDDGDIRGTVTLTGASDHTGITVYIPGTSFIALTDADGNFVISDVPPGEYPFLRADHEGYNPAIASAVVVPDGDELAMDPMVLTLDTGSAGSFVFAAGDYSTSATVELLIATTADAVLMIVSESSTFTNGQWIPVSSSHHHTFSSDGEHSLYIKFANAAGLESAPRAETITIDTDPRVALQGPTGSIPDTLPTLSWSMSRIAGAEYRVQVDDDPAFGSPLVDQGGLTDLDYTLTTPLSNGTTYHFRVAIEDGAMQWSFSEAATFTIDLSVVNLVGPVGTTNDSTPQFSWSATTLAGATYTFELARDAAFGDIVNRIEGLTTTTHSPSVTLTQGQQYYWRVAVVDTNDVQGSWAGPAAMTLDVGTVVFNCSLPAASPANDLTPTLHFCANPVAADYELVYGTASDLSGGAVASGSTTSITLPALPSADAVTYYYAVTPIDGAGVRGSRSSIRSFLLDSVAPTVTVTIAGGAADFPFSSDVPVTLQLADGSGTVNWTLASDAAFTMDLHTGSGSGTVQATRDFASLNATEQGTMTVHVRVSDGLNQRTASDSTQLSRYLHSGSIASTVAWSAVDRPHVLNGAVSVGPTATLNIGPGVTLYGTGNELRVYGVLDISGTNGSRVAIDDTRITQYGPGGAGEGVIDIQFADISGGTLYAATGGSGAGSLLLRDSHLTDVNASGMFYIWYPVADCFIERNVFDHTGRFSIGHNNGIQVNLTNNVFVNYDSWAIENWAAYDTSMTNVHFNSFLDVGEISVGFDPIYDSAQMDATENYWGTTEDAVIQSMIFDQNDDFGAAGVIPYTPTLSSPHASTPSYP